MIGKTNTKRQTDILIYINSEVREAVILSTGRKPLHALVQYLNGYAKYQNLSTNSSSQVDFTTHALP